MWDVKRFVSSAYIDTAYDIRHTKYGRRGGGGACFNTAHCECNMKISQNVYFYMHKDIDT
jgi:hypothetical protein